jgi:hypothetical protein
MSDAQDSNLRKKYRDILAPIFEFKDGDPLEFVAALLRLQGMEDPGWDPLRESLETLQDLMAFSSAELPEAHFPDAGKTRLRLLLFAYSHLVEMDAPYDILANLCLFKAKGAAGGLPFAPSPKAPNQPRPPRRKLMTIGPSDKIAKLKVLSEEAGVPDIGSAFDNFYQSLARNGFAHSAYVIHEDEYRVHYLAHDRYDNSAVVVAETVTLSDLRSWIAHAIAFYEAFFGLEQGARRMFSRFKGQALPYDPKYKGLLEFLFDAEGSLCGFVVHWPNGTESRYQRTEDGGSEPLNIRYGDNGLSLYVGEKHRVHDSFSPLLAPGEAPRYTPLRGTEAELSWPSDSMAKGVATDPGEPSSARRSNPPDRGTAV